MKNNELKKLIINEENEENKMVGKRKQEKKAVVQKIISVTREDKAGNKGEIKNKARNCGMDVKLRWNRNITFKILDRYRWKKIRLLANCCWWLLSLCVHAKHVRNLPFDYFYGYVLA